MVMPTNVIATVPQQQAVTTSIVSTPLIATTTTQTSTETIETNKDLLRVRIDGRKSVNYQIKGSPLYGVPSWWGEEDESEPEDTAVVSKQLLDHDNEMPFSDSELIPKRPGTQILRDIAEHRPYIASTLHERLTSSDTEKQADSNTPTSFVLEFEGPKKRRKPPIFLSKRPASYGSELSKQTGSSKGSSSMVRTPQRRTNRRPPSTLTGKTVTKTKPPSGSVVKNKSPQIKKNKK